MQSSLLSIFTETLLGLRPSKHRKFKIQGACQAPLDMVKYNDAWFVFETHISFTHRKRGKSFFLEYIVSMATADHLLLQEILELNYNWLIRERYLRGKEVLDSIKTEGSWAGDAFFNRLLICIIIVPVKAQCLPQLGLFSSSNLIAQYMRSLCDFTCNFVDCLSLCGSSNMDKFNLPLLP